MGSLTTTTNNPHILIIPGGASPAPLYTSLAAHLTALGYSASVHTNPSSDPSHRTTHPSSPPPGLSSDGAFQATHIRTLADAGHAVVLLAHSYGGLVANEAARGLGLAERAEQMLPGGVVRIVYLSCIVADIGQTSGEVTGELDFSWLAPVDDTAQYVRNTNAAAVVLSDIQPPEKAAALMEGFSDQSTRVFADAVTYDAFRHIPVSYILCERDAVLLPEWQRERIEFLRKARADGDVHVVRFDTGHCPNVSEPEVAARKVVEAIL